VILLQKGELPVSDLRMGKQSWYTAFSLLAFLERGPVLLVALLASFFMSIHPCLIGGGRERKSIA